MKENSIEEDIKDLKKYISFSKKHENFSHDVDWKWHKEIGEKIERVLKENEELKDKYATFVKMSCEIVEQSIPVQKVKDKIEEILNNGEYRIIFEGDAENPDEATIINAQKYIKLEKLQELLEGKK